MSGTQSVGMMDPAFFVSRGELLGWLNELLGLGYTKIEQTASGVAHCLIIDAVHRGKVRLDKVNFRATKSYEWVQNYKVLQMAFDKVGIDKHVDVDRLIKGRYQDNLEQCQWIKWYFDQHWPEDTPLTDYPIESRLRLATKGTYKWPGQRPGAKRNASARKGSNISNSSSNGSRTGSRTAAGAGAGSARRTVGGPKSGTVATPVAAASVATTSAKAKTTPTSFARRLAATATKAKENARNVDNDTAEDEDSSNATVAMKAEAVAVDTETAAKLAAAEEELQRVRKTVADLKLTVNTLEIERDYYFKKLRAVENLTQEMPESDVIRRVHECLYGGEETAETGAAATDNEDNDSNGFDDTAQFEAEQVAAAMEEAMHATASNDASDAPATAQEQQQNKAPVAMTFDAF